MADSWPRAVRAGAAFRRRVWVSERKTLLTYGGKGGRGQSLVRFSFLLLPFGLLGGWGRLERGFTDCDEGVEYGDGLFRV